MGRVHADNVDDDILIQFKKLVIEKYGCFKGYYSIAVQDALKLYIELNGGTNTQKVRDKDKIPKRKDLWKKVWAIYVELFRQFGVGKTFTFAEFGNIVNLVLGYSDPRTLRKYAEILVSQRVLVAKTPLVGRKWNTLRRIRLELTDFEEYQNFKRLVEEILGEKLPSILAVKNHV